MRRLEIPEIHDHPQFPSRVRDFITDALQVLWRFGRSYHPILPRLYKSLCAAGSREILDLCSGGGGPWPSLLEEIEIKYCTTLALHMTDKYPNVRTSKKIVPSRHSPAEVRLEPLDATKVPATLVGFRTMFSSFHHFDPFDARQIMIGAVEGGHGIAIFELAARKTITLSVLCFTPFLVLCLTPFIRPVSWSRLFLTYVIPIVPFVIWYDGLVSCLRAYSMEELREMIEEVSSLRPDYNWQLGEERAGLLPITYLIGSPASRQSHRPTRLYT
jgi:hypothetical protein